VKQNHHEVYFEGTPKLQDMKKVDEQPKDAADSALQGAVPRDSGSIPLRRHGDQVEVLKHARLRGAWPGVGQPGGAWPRDEVFRIHGRVDDTMNLGGIKVSSVGIERLLNSIGDVSETAAIAIPPAGGGPSNLVVYVVLVPEADIATDELQVLFQNLIRKELNPLFKIHDVVVVDELPRTASNKVMRRVLRKSYQQQGKTK
jgi:acetyl-CoA synthetase